MAFTSSSLGSSGGGSPDWMSQLQGGLGGVGNFIGSMFMKNPADAAQKYLNQIPGTVTPYYQPYINAGNDALGKLQSQFSQLLANPGAFLNTMGQSFQQSPGFQYSVDQATKAANNAAAAGGMLGSPAEQQELAKSITGMANQDYYNWLSKTLGLYDTGLSGYGHIFDTGFQASNDLASMLGTNLENQASYGYAGQANQNQSMGGGIGSLLGGLGSLLPFFMM